jgi:geranyl-CoA carboxylase alpha subunit
MMKLQANISRVLVANRGEIACRVIDSVQAAGLEAVAVYSDADASALFVALADACVAIGGQTPAESYLDIHKIIAAALKSGADAIHPGYGFLSENAEFASACAAKGITFIGPSPEAIRLMGNKASAKALMIEAGVPCVPGYQGDAQDNASLVAAAQKIGFPLMVKAAAGGGGRGMRLVQKAAELEEAIDSARAEAASAFGSGELILERAILHSRHIEVQIAGDQHGNVIHLGERDCSAQRRHQKVIEECPSPFVSTELRERMGLAAVNAARAVNYAGVGTVEFLVDEDQHFYFLEMNTRLQVEHPVTELVTDTDLVDWQLQIANGQPLPCGQGDIQFDGHAIEVRIYAEDPTRDFMPQTGTVVLFEPYEHVGVRIDHGLYSGCQVTPYYDAMLAKVICWGRDREEARRRLVRALSQTRLLGLVTNKRFLVQLLNEPTFIQGETTTAFISPELLTRLNQPDHQHEMALAAALIARQGSMPKFGAGSWSNTQPMPVIDKLQVNAVVTTLSSLTGGNICQVQVEGFAQGVDIRINACNAGQVSYTCDGVDREAVFHLTDEHISIDLGARSLHAEIVTYVPAASKDAASSGQIKASTEGLVVEVLVAVGDTVVKGQTLLIVEAMKMQHRHLADGDGEVVTVAVTSGSQVKNRQFLVALNLVESEHEPA